MQAIYEFTPVIAAIIFRSLSGCACLHSDWAEAKAMVEGILAEPWHLIGYQEDRLREFLKLLQLENGAVARQ